MEVICVEVREVFDWLVEQGTFSTTLAAATLLAGEIVSVADGELALSGGPTDLPEKVREGSSPEKFREIVEDIDLPKREWLLEVLGSPQLVRRYVNHAKEKLVAGDIPETWISNMACALRHFISPYVARREAEDMG